MQPPSGGRQRSITLMRLTPQQKITTAFTSAAIIVVVIGALAYWSASRTREAAVLLARNQQVVNTLETVIGVDDELSTAERDYVVSGNRAYLRAYHEAVASTGEPLRKARQLTTHNPWQQGRLRLISGLIGRFETLTAHTMAVRRVRGFPPAAALLLSGAAEALKHAINTNVAAIIAQARRHLAQRQLQMTRASSRALDLILVGSGLAVLIGLVASVRVRRDFRALQQAEERFRALMDCAPDAMVVVDRDSRIVLVNVRAETLFGYKRRELIGKPLEILMPTGYGAGPSARRDAAIAAPTPSPADSGAELFARRHDGSQFPVEVTLSPVAMPAGLHVVGAIRDVSDRKRALQQLSDARAEAERADRAKSIFLATASHDLRQPLQTISLLNGALRRMDRAADPQEALTQQGAAIDVMSHLLNALLDISKLESGAVKPALTDWRVDTLFAQLRAEFADVAAHKSVQVQVQAGPVWVRSDLSLVGQVLRNLLSNAIKYTSRGRVRLRARSEGEAVRIEVSDTGIGMAAQEIGHIYEEFYQIGVPMNATREGYGLGLSIVSRIVKLLNLKLDVHSEVGQGSTFVLTLPAGAAVVGSNSQADAGIAAPRSAQSACHVLVVDDEPAVLDATRLLLSAEGYRVSTANSLAQAIERVATSADLGLVITDYHLARGETGRQVIASARQILGPNVKAVLITGDTSTAARELDDDRNLHLLNKPVHPDMLLGLLKGLLASELPAHEQA